MKALARVVIGVMFCLELSSLTFAASGDIWYTRENALVCHNWQDLLYAEILADQRDRAATIAYITNKVEQGDCIYAAKGLKLIEMFNVKETKYVMGVRRPGNPIIIYTSTFCLEQHSEPQPKPQSKPQPKSQSTTPRYQRF